jgi:hypothetical protein
VSAPRVTKTIACTTAILALLVGCGAAGGDAGSRQVAADPVTLRPPAAAAPTPSTAAVPSSPPPAVPARGRGVPSSADEAITRADRGTALAVLGTLAVKGRAPKTGYERDVFGPAWADIDRNGCDTRNDILARDLTGETFKAGTRDCVVMSGQLAEPYTGATLSFTKANAAAVHIDHVVALSDAWQKGAQAWPAGKRLAFANDPLNLLAVDGPANSSKGDGDAATWLPPNKPYRCELVARQVAVKAKYELWVVAPERDAIAQVLSTCAKQVAPTGGSPTLAPVAPPRKAPAQEASSPAAQAPSPAAGAKTYANCTELRKDYRGGVARPGAVNQGGATKNTPHYDSALYEANTKSDRDKDGIACEN